METLLLLLNLILSWSGGRNERTTLSFWEEKKAHSLPFLNCFSGWSWCSLCFRPHPTPQLSSSQNLWRESQCYWWKWVFLDRVPPGFPLRRKSRSLWKMSNCPEAKLVLSQQWQNHCQMSKDWICFVSGCLLLRLSVSVLSVHVVLVFVWLQHCSLL